MLLLSAGSNPLRTRVYPLEGGKVAVLDVPFVSQNPPSNYCFVAALKMAWDFIRIAHRTGKPDEAAPELSFEELCALTKTDPLTGTVVSPDFLTAFNSRQKLVDAEMREGVDLEEMKKMAARGFPVIACYYPSMAIDQESEVPGAGHACVYLGHTELRVLIHNPWYGPFHQWPTRAFSWSREQLADLAIIFTVRSHKAKQSLLPREPGGSGP